MQRRRILSRSIACLVLVLHSLLMCKRGCARARTRPGETSPSTSHRRRKEPCSPLTLSLQHSFGHSPARRLHPPSRHSWAERAPAVQVRPAGRSALLDQVVSQRAGVLPLHPLGQPAHGHLQRQRRQRRRELAAAQTTWRKDFDVIARRPWQTGMEGKKDLAISQ